MKKILCIILSLILIMALMPFAVSANQNFENEIAVLESLNILKGYEDGSMRPEAPITRAELVAVVNRALGLEDAAKAATNQNLYTDVAADAWYAGDVNLATQMGIIAGDGNGLFRPEDQVKYEEVVKMMVAACGYTQEYTLSRGGWPTGYLVIATENNITKGLSKPAGTPALRGTVAKLTYNTLTAPMLVVNSFSSENTTYKADPNTTILGTKLNLEKITGYVNANHISAINGSALSETGTINLVVDKRIGKNHIQINNNITKPINSSYDLTLGYNYSIYINEDLEVVAWELNENPSVSFNNKNYDIEYIDNYFKVQDKNEDSIDYFYCEDLIFIVNGEKVNYNDNILNGDIVLLDNNNDNLFDIAFITNYEVATVDYLYANNTKIAFKESNIASLDLTNYINNQNYSYSILLNGEEIFIEDLKEYDVLNIRKSNKHIDILVSRNTIKGMIEEFDPYENIYIIGDQEYKSIIGPFNIQDEGTFYLTIFNEIAYFESDNTISENIGYVTGAGLGSSTIDKDYEIQLLNKNGDLITYSLADKIRFNKNYGIEEETVYNSVYNSHPVIAYNINSNNELSSIEVLTAKEETNIKYKEKTSSFIGSYGVNEKAIVFYIPDGKAKNDYKVLSKNSLVDENIYNINFYDIDEYDNANILVIKNNINPIGLNTNLAIVTKISSVSDNGNVVAKIEFLQNGQEKFLITDYEDYNSNVVLTKGTIFEYTTNLKGNINNIITDYNYITGTIIDKQNYNIIFENGDRHNLEDANIYIVDKTKEGRIKCYVAALGDIQKSNPDTKSVAYIKYDSNDEILDIVVVIENK